MPHTGQAARVRPSSLRIRRPLAADAIVRAEPYAQEASTQDLRHAQAPQAQMTVDMWSCCLLSEEDRRWLERHVSAQVAARGIEWRRDGSLLWRSQAAISRADGFDHHLCYASSTIGAPYTRWASLRCR